MPQVGRQIQRSRVSFLKEGKKEEIDNSLAVRLINAKSLPGSTTIHKPEPERDC